MQTLSINSKVSVGLLVLLLGGLVTFVSGWSDAKAEMRIANRKIDKLEERDEQRAKENQALHLLIIEMKSELASVKHQMGRVERKLDRSLRAQENP